MLVYGRARSSLGPARVRNVRRDIRVFAGTKSSGSKAKVSFSMPYRCQFGQQICIVGKGRLLGDWNVNDAVPMKWSAGDVWNADLNIAAGMKDKLEYKYIVRDSNGHVHRWMDGGNAEVEIPDFLGKRGGTILVNDTWDHSCHDISISFEGVPGVSSHELDAEIRQMTAAASPSGKHNREANRTSEIAHDNEMAILQSSIERALQDLSIAMDQSDDVVEDMKDPSHPNALEVDRKVAASYNRVMALSKALKASATDLRLPQPPRCFSHRPSSWRFDRVPAWTR